MNASTLRAHESQASITARRGSRSATTPPTSVNATRAIVNAASTPPSAVAELLIERTANARATRTRASPAADETPEPEQSKLSLRQGCEGFPQPHSATPETVSRRLSSRFLQTMVVIAVRQGCSVSGGAMPGRGGPALPEARRRGAPLREARAALPPDAEDVLQARFMRALRAIARGERVQKPRNWLIKIAHNECRRALSVRRAGRSRSSSTRWRRAGRERPAEELRAAPRSSRPKQREALVLRELEGRCYAEIATTLEISGSAVETLIFRARRAVREQLEPRSPARSLRAHRRRAMSDGPDAACAPTRGVRACATLRAPARGRKSALRRSPPASGCRGSARPSWARSWSSPSPHRRSASPASRSPTRPRRRLPDVAPLQVDRPEIPPVVGPRHATARARTRAVRARPALGRPSSAQRRLTGPRAPARHSRARGGPGRAAAGGRSCRNARACRDRLPPRRCRAATPAAKPVLPLPKLPVELAVPALPAAGAAATAGRGAGGARADRRIAYAAPRFAGRHTASSRASQRPIGYDASPGEDPLRRPPVRAHVQAPRPGCLPLRAGGSRPTTRTPRTSSRPLFSTRYRSYPGPAHSRRRPEHWVTSRSRTTSAASASAQPPRRPREVAAASREHRAAATENEGDPRYTAGGHPARALSVLTFPQRTALAMRELEGRSLQG